MLLLVVGTDVRNGTREQALHSCVAQSINQSIIYTSASVLSNASADPEVPASPEIISLWASTGLAPVTYQVARPHRRLHSNER
jgi:hypothetical protein